MLPKGDDLRERRRVRVLQGRRRAQGHQGNRGHRVGRRRVGLGRRVAPFVNSRSVEMFMERFVGQAV